MMKLSLMAAFFDTADDEDRHSPLADAIAARWVGSDAKVGHRRSSANFVFAVSADKEYFLRFNHESERDRAYIEAELDCVEYLAGQGQKVARPVPSPSGARVEQVENELGTFYAVLFEAMPGRHHDLDDLDEAAFRRWGRALGELHTASLDLDADRPSWVEHLADMRGTIPLEESGAHGELNEVEARLEALDAAPDEFGLIHFDFEMDNLLWDGDAIGVVDFDDCAYYPLEADIAMALRDLCDDRLAHFDLEDERLQTFVAGYRDAKALSDAALRRLPLYMRLNNLVQFARKIWSLDEGPLRQEPQWTADLRRGFAEGLAESRHDFVENPVRLYLP